MDDLTAWWPYIQEFVRRVQMAHAEVGRPKLTVTSWWRSYAHNAQVGGNPHSQHLLGIAMDLTGDPADLVRFRGAARSYGLTPVDEGDHTHLQLFPAGTIRWS